MALGGALTIPNLDVVVFPQRGDALVTFNEGNFEHTLCPIVVGTSMSKLAKLSKYISEPLLLF